VFRTYDYQCQACRKREVRLVEETERDLLQECKCGMQMQRVFSRPHVRTEKLSASFVDGQRRRSKAFMDLERQNELEDAMHDAEDFQSRQEVAKELDKLIGTN